MFLPFFYNYILSRFLMRDDIQNSTGVPLVYESDTDFYKFFYYKLIL